MLFRSQLSRPIFHILPEEAASGLIRRFDGKMAGTSWLYGLRTWDWNFDGDPYNGYYSLFRNGPAGLRVSIGLSPGIHEHGEKHKEQKLSGLRFAEGSPPQLSPVAFSELMRQLTGVLVL